MLCFPTFVWKFLDCDSWMSSWNVSALAFPPVTTKHVFQMKDVLPCTVTHPQPAGVSGAYFTVMCTHTSTNFGSRVYYSLPALADWPFFDALIIHSHLLSCFTEQFLSSVSEIHPARVSVWWVITSSVFLLFTFVPRLYSRQQFLSVSQFLPISNLIFHYIHV